MNTQIQVFTNLVSLGWLSWQRTPLKLEAADLTGQTVVVTGANRGIGLEAAKHFSCMNVGCLILACRDGAAGEAAVRAVLNTPGCTCQSVSCWPLDLASFASVSAFATRFGEEKHSLDILVCNAGLMSFAYSQTSDGWEKIQPSADSRILIVTSESQAFIHRVEEADGPLGILETLNDPQHCTNTIGKRYFVSKLFSLFFAREFARRQGSKPSLTVVTRYITHVTDFFIARAPEMGSRTIVHAAVNPNGKQQNGRYLANCRVEQESDFSLSEEGLEVQNRLWEETINLLCEIDPRVNDILQRLHL
ncbi:hypothetical protein C8R44DRAFT_945643 [Mycena epipterygia]|nr:hypothetical protein C8R44DRAFT_945643 [Mycena epipterygia]